MAALTKAAFRAGIKGLRVRVHIHPPPTCAGGTHDTSCAGRGKEIICKLISYKGIKACACVHQT